MANSGSVIRRFNHLLGELDAVYHDLSFRLGMSDSVSKILYTICDAGTSCPLHLICQRTGLSKQTVNSALRKLEREGPGGRRPVQDRLLDPKGGPVLRRHRPKDPRHGKPGLGVLVPGGGPAVSGTDRAVFDRAAGKSPKRVTWFGAGLDTARPAPTA